MTASRGSVLGAPGTRWTASVHRCLRLQTSARTVTPTSSQAGADGMGTRAGFLAWAGVKAQRSPCPRPCVPQPPGSQGQQAPRRSASWGGAASSRPASTALLRTPWPSFQPQASLASSPSPQLDQTPEPTRVEATAPRKEAGSLPSQRRDVIGCPPVEGRRFLHPDLCPWSRTAGKSLPQLHTPEATLQGTVRARPACRGTWRRGGGGPVVSASRAKHSLSFPSGSSGQGQEAVSPLGTFWG